MLNVNEIIAAAYRRLKADRASKQGATEI